MKTSRPVNLDLTKYRFPRMAIVSVIHRVTGIVLFLSIPLLIYWLHRSLLSSDMLMGLQFQLQEPLMKFIVWVISCAAAYHLLAGIRHIIMDLGFFEGLQGGRATATLLLGVSIVVFILLGVWLW